MSHDRDAWRDFICSSTHPYRHLSSLGSSVVGSYSPPLDLAGLSEFLLKLRGDHDVTLLADMVDLIAGKYADFFANELQRLLDHLANRMESRDEVVGPTLRGNPRWDRTIVARIGGTLPIGRYHSRVAYRSFSLPENQLLRWLVEEVSMTVRALVRQSSSRKPHFRLTELLRHCEEAQAHHWFSLLPTPDRLSREMIDAAKRSRLVEYRIAADLAETRSRLKDKGSEARWYAILMLLAVGWLEPVSDDDLFELYSLTLILDVIANELGFGEPEEYGLVTADRNHVAGFRTATGYLRVLFDQNPGPSTSAITKYRPIVKAHSGVTGNARRPDITLIFDRADSQSRRQIVEIKRSSDERYISDSVYKVFGYLHDFAAMWQSSHPCPRSILLVPDGVARLPDTQFQETAIVSSSDRAAIASAISAGLL